MTAEEMKDWAMSLKPDWWIVLFSAFFLNSPKRTEDERHDT